jgi:hypothetical protein
MLRVVETWEIEEGAYPMLLEAEGSAPPQSEELDDEK